MHAGPVSFTSHRHHRISQVFVCEETASKLSKTCQQCLKNWTGQKTTTSKIVFPLENSVLVGGFDFPWFSISWECHHPNWLYFSEGLGFNHQPGSPFLNNFPIETSIFVIFQYYMTTTRWYHTYQPTSYSYYTCMYVYIYIKIKKYIYKHNRGKSALFMGKLTNQCVLSPIFPRNLPANGAPFRPFTGGTHQGLAFSLRREATGPEARKARRAARRRSEGGGEAGEESCATFYCFCFF